MDNKEYINIENSSSYSPDTKVPGHLFLWNKWETRNPTPNSGNLTLLKKCTIFIFFCINLPLFNAKIINFYLLRVSEVKNRYKAYRIPYIIPTIVSIVPIGFIGILPYGNFN